MTWSEFDTLDTTEIVILMMALGEKTFFTFLSDLLRPRNPYERIVDSNREAASFVYNDVARYYASLRFLYIRQIKHISSRM